MQILIRLTAYTYRHRLHLFLALLALLLSNLFYIAIPRILGIAIDEVLGAAELKKLIGLSIAIIVVAAMRGIFQYTNMYLAEAISQRVSYTIRNSFYDKLQHLGFAFHDHEHTGNLMSKATVDVETVRFFISMGLIRSGQIILLVIGAGALMISMDWRLGLASLFFIPIIAFRAVLASRQLRKIWRQVQDEMGHMTTILQENLAGIRVVKAFGADDHEQRKFERQIDRVFASTYSAQRLQASNSSIMQLIFWGSTGLILWLGGQAVIEARITVGELVQFIFFTSLLVQPVRMVGWMVNIFSRAMSAGERIFLVLDSDSAIPESPEARYLKQVKGQISFKHVSFNYGDLPTIQDFSLDIPAGTAVALLGPPGAGKSTVTHLLGRFYDVTKGTIAIDGTDIKNFTVESLRANVGIVQQDIFIFSATVQENVAYGKQTATIDEVVAAAKTAQIHDEIIAMPEGYQTMVGERGMSLSGGQRQRIAIARTLLMNPPILVLDDSTSSVDSGTEARIQAAMKEVVKDRTTLIVAHRLSSIQHANLAVVIEKGQIVQMGIPSQLIQVDGPYRDIAELQYVGGINSLDDIREPS